MALEADYFDYRLAIDPTAGAVVPNATAEVYAVADTAFATPLAITDVTGVSLAELVASPTGVFPQFMVPGSTQVMIRTSGGIVTPAVSVGGAVADVPDATEAVKGVARFATVEQTLAGALDDAAVHPVALAEALATVGGGAGAAVTFGPTAPSAGFWIESSLPIVTATAPTFTDLSGTASDTYTIPSVANVEYLVGGVVVAAGSYPGSGTVTVTARPVSGYALNGPSSWTFTFTTGTDPLIPVTPTAPTFNDTTDEYTIPTTTGVNYQISGSTVAAGTYTVTPPVSVTVTAVAQAGYTITGTSSWSFSFTSPSTTPRLKDTFTGADDTVMPGRVTDSTGATTTATWSGTGGKILSNQMAPTGSESLLNIGIATYKLTVTAASPVSLCTVILRWQDASNYVYLQWRSSTGKWGVISKQGGAGTLVLDTGVAPAAGDVLEVTADGTGYSVKVNGGTATTGANTFLASNTVIGFREIGARWDDLTIHTL